jgi:uncharacterized membrane protein SirB2
MLMHFSKWLAATPISNLIQNVLWIIPLVQTIHILSIAIVLSSVGMVVLRILGMAGLRSTFSGTAERYLPWIWGALTVLLCSGAVLVTGEPVRSLTNPTFQLKMCLLLVAVLITLAFQVTVHRNARFWDFAPSRFGAAKLFAVGAFVLWLAIAVAGRWIAYTQLSYV